MRHKFYISTVAIFLLTANAFGQVEKINTDRPDQTDAPYVLDKRYLQFELGVSIQKDNSAEKDFSLPTLLVRYGLLKNAELRIATTIDHYPVSPSSYQTGLQPIEIGGKLALAKEKKWFPETAVIFGFVFPKWASKNLQADKLAPNVALSMQNTISKKWGIAYNAGATWDGFSNGPSWTYSASLGCDITENWDAFIEGYGSFSKDDAPSHNIDTGLGYYVNSNFKLDISTGFAVSKVAPGWFLAVGGSWRLKCNR